MGRVLASVLLIAFSLAVLTTACASPSSLNETGGAPPVAESVQAAPVATTLESGLVLTPSSAELAAAILETDDAFERTRCRRDPAHRSLGQDIRI